MSYKKICGIYSIENIKNGKQYIGSSNHIKERWNRHRYDLNHNQHDNRHLQFTWNRYKKDSFEFKILKLCKEENLLRIEQFYIDKYDFDKLYNICPSAFRSKHSEESKLRLKETWKVKGHPFLNRHHSEESKKKMSIKRKGTKYVYKNDIEKKVHKDEIENYLLGGWKLGRKPSVGIHLRENTPRKYGKDNPNYGKKRTQETKDKISKSLIENGNLKGDKHPFYNKKREEHACIMREKGNYFGGKLNTFKGKNHPSAKHYILISPNKEKFDIVGGLGKFLKKIIYA